MLKKDQKGILRVRIFIVVLYIGIATCRFHLFSISFWRKARAQWQLRKQVWYPKRVMFINGKYYWNLNIPGFPSRAFTNVVQKEFNTLLNRNNKQLASLIFAITKKCSLNCQHCFEWNEINKKEFLSDEKVHSIVGNMMQSYHPGQLWFSGGEPLIRYPLVVDVIRKNKRYSSDFWVITSGKGTSDSKFQNLKKAGLKGVIISLDHYIEEEHNRFRGDKNSFECVLQCIADAKNNNLVAAVTLCPQKGKVNNDFLNSYFEFAKYLKVDFVQVMEPRAQGKYASKNVALSKEEQICLTEFYNICNSGKNTKAFPIMAYPDLVRRKIGCSGGKRLAYIDTDGTLNPCPFCKHRSHSACGPMTTERSLYKSVESALDHN